MAPASMLLVHSPLVGPSSCSRLAEAAIVAGFDVALADLTIAATSEDPHAAYCDAAIDAATKLEHPPLVVGHSGAGAFLPLIGAELGDTAGLVFVDAVVPPVAGEHRASAGFTTLLDSLSEGGVLPRWLDWWPDAVVADLLPDEADRVELSADMPQLCRTFYDAGVAVPTDWSAGACSFLLLSDAYAAEHHDATERGWPTATRHVGHLGLFTHPEAVLDQVVALAARATSVDR